VDVKLRVFKAVANEKRMRMIESLHRKGRISLREISNILDIPEATACRNLKILENAGLVKSEIRNGIAAYWIDNAKTPSVIHDVLQIIIRK